jgi:hypothetical protein
MRGVEGGPTQLYRRVDDDEEIARLRKAIDKKNTIIGEIT